MGLIVCILDSDLNTAVDYAILVECGYGFIICLTQTEHICLFGEMIALVSYEASVEFLIGSGILGYGAYNRLDIAFFYGG